MPNYTATISLTKTCIFLTNFSMNLLNLQIKTLQNQKWHSFGSQAQYAKWLKVQITSNIFSKKQIKMGFLKLIMYTKNIWACLVISFWMAKTIWFSAIRWLSISLHSFLSIFYLKITLFIGSMAFRNFLVWWNSRGPQIGIKCSL